MTSTGFAIVVPGRAVQQAIAVPDTAGQFAISLDNAEALNHICVFQTAPLPEGYGCTLHFDPGKGTGWSLIGGLTNEKPSAIFRLRGNLIPSSSSSTLSAPSFSSPTSTTSATLGILCEPLAAVEAHLAQLPISSANSNIGAGALVLKDPMTNPTTLAMLVAKNMFNAIAGFAQQIPGTMTYAVELGVVEKWYSRFVEKIKAAGVGFLQQQD
ncbi:BQ5605_C016g08088 [Microbotryum silenes-dioicae]|uniref:BQ5605_C016g08088 protein n=1 Tax=Microbotryum silenes-dioicae TaxID=796604 RepID=A0A2X0LVF9_9BASI|nr:BQ5605_C016g08088 [Microbotryum silenes-dioicae]